MSDVERQTAMPALIQLPNGDWIDPRRIIGVKLRENPLLRLRFIQKGESDGGVGSEAETESPFSASQDQAQEYGWVGIDLENGVHISIDVAEKAAGEKLRDDYARLANDVRSKYGEIITRHGNRRRFS